MDKIDDISGGFLTYDDHQEISAHQCSIDLVEIYSNHLAIHLNTLKENLLEEYKKRYEINEIPTARVTCHQATATPAVSLISPHSASDNHGQRDRRLLNERAAAIDSRNNTPMDIAAEPAQRGQSPRPETKIDAPLYFKLKTTLEVIFVSGWGEFITQYQFNELDNRMSKLEKGQTVTMTAGETAVELDREMSMDAELTGKFITQKVTVAMDEKSREYEKKIKHLEKSGKEIVKGESTRKNGTRGGGRASKKNKPSKTQLTPKSGPHPKSASRSAPRRQSILQSPFARKIPKRRRCRQRYARIRAPRAHQGRHCRPQKPTTPNSAVGPKKGEGKLWLPSKRALVGKTKRARHPYHYGKVVLFLPTY